MQMPYENRFNFVSFIVMLLAIGPCACQSCPKPHKWITQNRDAAQSLRIDFVITSIHQLDPVYEDPDVFKVDPHTQDNLAYGHVQQSAQLKGPIYEDIKPDPHTQGNTAYGHVQFNSF